ncbi:hypothetical protein Hanom_Chr02g00125521 [Helianthus anomalus]
MVCTFLIFGVPMMFSVFGRCSGEEDDGGIKVELMKRVVLVLFRARLGSVRV